MKKGESSGKRTQKFSDLGSLILQRCRVISGRDDQT